MRSFGEVLAWCVHLAAQLPGASGVGKRQPSNGPGNSTRATKQVANLKTEDVHFCHTSPVDLYIPRDSSSFVHAGSPGIEEEAQQFSDQDVDGLHSLEQLHVPFHLLPGYSQEPPFQHGKKLASLLPTTRSWKGTRRSPRTRVTAPFSVPTMSLVLLSPTNTFRCVYH